MSKTFYSHSFGCRVNQAEKEQFDSQLVQKGYTYDSKRPSLYIINSCAVTNKAEREARQLIYTVKRTMPDTKIILTGCAATNWLKLGIKVPEVDYLVDNQQKEYLAALIHKRYFANQMHANGKQNTAVIHDKYLNSKRVIIKIQDGCNRFCSFCIVPYLRGLPKSTSISTIVDHIRTYESDIKEVILTAINTEAYGYDTKESFIDLLDSVVKQTNVERISFGSIHPWTVKEQFLQWYKNIFQEKRIVNFFHIPLQSGSNKILQLMKRGYTREEFIEKLNTLQSIDPFIFIGTDIIVGYLEETDKDFEDTYTFLEKSPINKFHVFRFSKRSHTAAYYLAKRLQEPTPEIKVKRAKALIDLSNKKYNTFLKKHIGKTLSALFLEKSEHSIQHGLLNDQIPVKVRFDKHLKGQIKNVKIIDYKNGALFGKIV